MKTILPGVGISITVARPSYLYNGNPFTGKISLYWDGRRVRFSIKMQSYSCRNSHYKDKTASRLSYLVMGIPVSQKTVLRLKQDPGGLCKVSWCEILEFILNKKGLMYLMVIWKEDGKVSVDCMDRADSRFAPSQWETTLLCNDVSHWLGASLKSALMEWFLSIGRVKSDKIGAIWLHNAVVKFYNVFTQYDDFVVWRDWLIREMKAWFVLLFKIKHWNCLMWPWNCL